MREESEERSGGEKRGLDVPIRPDLIPIGCPNLSRLRASIGKSGVGTDGGDRRGETRGRIGRREREGEGGVSAGRRNGGEYPIDRDEGEENSRRNERASERSACEFRLVSFRFRDVRDLIGEKKKCLHFSPSVETLRLTPSLEIRKEQRVKKGKSYVTCPRVPGQNVLSCPIEDGNP